MRVLFVVFLLCISSSFGSENEPVGIKAKGLVELDLADTQFVSEIKQEVLKSVRSWRLRETLEADVTNYTNEILDNVGLYLVENGMDPMELSDELVDLLLLGKINMTNGWLQELSSIGTYENVYVTYSNDTKKLELSLPLSFDSLLITYKYKYTYLLITISGNIKAKISDVKINLHLGFDFSTYQAFVNKIDVKSSGKIDFEFTGLGLLDWMIDAFSSVLTTLFHNLILGIINAIVYNPVQSVVSEINSVINSILHPNSTSNITML